MGKCWPTYGWKQDRSYQALDRFLRTPNGRLWPKQPLERGVYAERHRVGSDNEGIAIRLWHSNVIIYYKDGRVALSACGWKTQSTFRAIGEYGPRGYDLGQNISEYGEVVLFYVRPF